MAVPIDDLALESWCHVRPMPVVSPSHLAAVPAIRLQLPRNSTGEGISYAGPLRGSAIEREARLPRPGHSINHRSGALGAETYRYLEPYSMVGFLFLIISIPTAAWLRKFEAWVSRSLGIVEREH